MNRADIEGTLREAAGHPTTGVVADIIPAMADALDAKLNPAPQPAANPAKDKATRVLDAGETR